MTDWHPDRRSGSTPRRPRTSRWTRSLRTLTPGSDLRPLVLAACAAGLGLVVGCAEPVELEPTLRPVRYEVVSSVSSDRVRSFAGVAQAGTESQLSFRVPGTVREVPVVVGQRVQRGDVLARLDRTDYQLKVQEARAGLAQAEAAERNAEADYDRVRGLYENSSASRRDLDGARAVAESSRAQVEAAEQRLEQARQQLAYCTLAAPADGVVAYADVAVNENVQAGQPLFLLTTAGEAEVTVALPEILIADVELGQPVAVQFDALPGHSFEGVVTEAGAAAVRSTTFPVTARLSSSHPGIRSGMAVEVRFTFRTAGVEEQLLVPAVAVGEDPQGRFVFVLEASGDEQGRVRRRSVTVGDLVGERLQILTGIEPGERVVTAGVRRLVDGEAVRMVETGA